MIKLYIETLPILQRAFVLLESKVVRYRGEASHP